MARIPGHTDTAPAPAAPYTQSVRIGSFVAAAGQVGFDPASRELVGDDVASQTRQALSNVAAVLEASGASVEDVIRVGVFLTDRQDFSSMNEVYAEFFTQPYPARTTVYVGLPEGMKVEIDAFAVLSDDS